MLHCITMSMDTYERGTFARQVKSYIGIEAMQKSLYYMWKTNNKQEANLPHLSPEKTVETINTYDNIITSIMRRKSHYVLIEN